MFAGIPEEYRHGRYSGAGGGLDQEAQRLRYAAHCTRTKGIAHSRNNLDNLNGFLNILFSVLLLFFW